MTKPIDLDAELNLDPEVKTVPITLFGRQWDVLIGVNTFALSDIGAEDPGSLARLIRNTVIESQRDDFANALASTPNLDGEALGRLINKLVEVQSERPTVAPSAKRRPATKRTSAPRSAGR